MWAQERQHNRGVEKTTQREALFTVELTKYYSGAQMKKNELVGSCGTYGGEERCLRGFDGESSWKETTWKT
jgi:hypothetical protein